jgi:hypothetical protein
LRAIAVRVRVAAVDVTIATEIVVVAIRDATETVVDAIRGGTVVAIAAEIEDVTADAETMEGKT